VAARAADWKSALWPAEKVASCFDPEKRTRSREEDIIVGRLLIHRLPI
jgi:hypothetical protein